MKRLLLTLSVLACGSVYSYGDMVMPPTTGYQLYVRGQFGVGYIQRSEANELVHYDYDDSGPYTASSMSTITNHRDGNQVAGRLGLGLDFNSIFGLELGGAFYPTVERRLSGNFFGLASPHHDFSTSSHTNYYSVDLMGKLRIPLAKLYIYGAAGVAWVYAEQQALAFSYTNSSGETYTIDDPGWGAGHHEFWRPRIEVGAGLQLSDRISIDVSASRIFGNGVELSKEDYLPDLDMITAGVTYHFYTF